MVLPVLLCLVLVLIAAGPAWLVFPKGRFASAAVYAQCLFATLGILALAIGVLLGGQPESTLTLPLGLPWIGARFRVDDLAALFLVVVNLGAAAASGFGLGSERHEQVPGRVVPLFPIFLAAMNLVVLADDAFTFLLSWEVMSVVSWGLVVAHHRHPDNLHAGFVYLVMAGIGTAALLLAFGVMAGVAEAYTFAGIRAATISPLAGAAALALVLIGTGSKAGLVPLHAWLPLAHPAAPSHVSALMSGVMTKVAVYGFVRIVFDLLGDPIWWWGAAVVTLGAISALVGVLCALMQHDLKRLLAYHTVENIGIIFVGLGLALAFRANGMNAAASLALTAGLLHVFNHSVFKSLLFLGAGAVLHATGDRDMERQGGLIHRMPVTAACFLIGSAAISALPPLNGFVSEWLLFQAVLVSHDLPQWELRFLVPAAGAMLALSAALAATCFVKAFGITFLGRPRAATAAAAVETDPFSQAAMVVLAFLCVMAGVFPGLFTDTLGTVVAPLAGGVRLPDQRFQDWFTLVPIAAERSSYSGFLVLVFMLFSGGFAVLAAGRLGSRALRRSPPWDCGFPNDDPATQYTAGSFAQPVRRVLADVAYHTVETVTMPPPGDLEAARHEIHLSDRIWDKLYLPVAGLVTAVADRINPAQFLTIRRYLALVFTSLVALLGVLALWR